ncbi:GDSL-type esterase/lipase family protein [Scytonema sp. NUACC21]
MNSPPDTRVLKILALGDSYTKGESVCSTCNFPTQLRDSINARRGNGLSEVQIIAQTGWTTPQLKNAINQTNPPNTFDLVTLLIGVNNQYQNMPFSFYENDFPELVQKAFFGRAKHGRKPPTSRQIVRTLTNQYFQRLRYEYEPVCQSLKWTFKTAPPKMVVGMALQLASVASPFKLMKPVRGIETNEKSRNSINLSFFQINETRWRD